jgi:hypothetical protein
VTRAVRAARKAGLDVARVEVDTTAGKIVLTMVSLADKTPPADALDKWLASHAH